MKKAFLAILLSLGTALSAVEIPNTLVATMERGGGLKFKHVTELSLFSRFVIGEPGLENRWFYSAEAGPKFNRSDVDGGYKWEFVTNDEATAPFKLNEYTVTVNDYSALVRFSSELVGDVKKGEYDFTMFFIPESLFAGRDYTVSIKGKSGKDGVFSTKIKEGKVVTLFENATCLDIDTPYGKLTISGTAFDVRDMRGKGFIQKIGDPHRGLWIGKSGMLKKGETLDSEITFSFTPADFIKYPTPLATTNKVTVTEEPTLITTYTPVPAITPMPQELTMTGERFNVTAFDRYVVIPGNADEADADRLTRAVDRVLREKLELPIIAGDANYTAGKLIKFVVSDEKFEGLTAPENPEGYALEIAADHITVVSRTARGAFYGLHCLANFYTANAFSGASILDWPDVEFRSMLLMVDDRSVEYLGWQIRDVLAPSRFNNIIVECEFAAWDSTKPYNVHEDWAISKDDLREIVRIGNDNFIDMSPLFQTLGHMEWLFKDPKNLDMAEYPPVAYAYNVSHPELYPLMLNTLKEIVDVFNNPKFLHIGHDEFAYGVPFPHRPENVAKGGKKIFYDDVQIYYDFAAERGMRIMLWQDAFIPYYYQFPDEAGESYYDLHYDIAQRLPKDVVICFWDYRPIFDTIASKWLQDEGFDILGCTWYEPENISNFTDFVIDNKMMGVMNTTWSGYRYSFLQLENNFYQCAQYISAGAWAWNSGWDNNFYSPGKILYNILNPRQRIAEGKGVKLDISELCNLDLSPEGHAFIAENTFSIEKIADHSGQAGQVKFTLPKRDGKPVALALKSANTPEFPAKVDIPLNIKAKKLFILHQARDSKSGDDSWCPFNEHDMRHGKPIGKYTLTYVDGSTAEFPIRYRMDIGRPFSDYDLDRRPGTAIEWQDGKFLRMIWYMTIENPKPELEIASIEFSTVEALYQLLLFGISAEQ